MSLLELFKGTGSIGKIAEKFGLDVVSLDFCEKYKPDILCDILDWDYKKYYENKPKPEIIWASLDYKTFSILSHNHRTKNIVGAEPLTEDAKIGDKIIQKTIEIIKYLKPKVWFIENPRGRLRSRPYLKNFLTSENSNRYTVYYCQFGGDHQKPTDIFSNIDLSVLEKKCRAEIRHCKKNISREKISIPPQLCSAIIYLSALDQEKRVIAADHMVLEVAKLFSLMI